MLADHDVGKPMNNQNQKLTSLVNLILGAAKVQAKSAAEVSATDESAIIRARRGGGSGSAPNADKDVERNNKFHMTRSERRISRVLRCPSNRKIVGHTICASVG